MYSRMKNEPMHLSTARTKKRLKITNKTCESATLAEKKSTKDFLLVWSRRFFQLWNVTFHLLEFHSRERFSPEIVRANYRVM